MNLYMYSVLDTATAQFGAPLCFVAPGQASRWFTDAVNQADKDNQYYMHPDDFVLYAIGRFETDTAMFESEGMNIFVRAKDVAVREINS